MQPVVYFMICDTCGLDGPFPHPKPPHCPSCGSSRFFEKQIEIPKQDPPFEVVTGSLDQQYEIVNRNLQIANSSYSFLEAVRIGDALSKRKALRDDGHPLWPVFDLDTKAISFSADLVSSVPTKGSIIYTVWDIENTLLYVGVAGLQRQPSQRNPLKKMESIASGQRQKEPFCLLIHDRYVIPTLVTKGHIDPVPLDLDKATREFIHGNLFFRFAHFTDEVSASVVRHYQKEIRRGSYGFPPPILNSVQRY